MLSKRVLSIELSKTLVRECLRYLKLFARVLHLREVVCTGCGFLWWCGVGRSGRFGEIELHRSSTFRLLNGRGTIPRTSHWASRLVGRSLFMAVARFICGDGFTGMVYSFWVCLLLHLFDESHCRGSRAWIKVQPVSIARMYCSASNYKKRTGVSNILQVSWNSLTIR